MSAPPDVRLMTLDPGHFHAALVQKEVVEGISPRADVYAPLGADLLAHLARVVACHRDSNRWVLLYRALFRITRGERSLLDIETDDVAAFVAGGLVGGGVFRLRAGGKGETAGDRQGEYELLQHLNPPGMQRRRGDSDPRRRLLRGAYSTR